MDKIDELLNRGVEKIFPNKEALEKILRSGKKLRLYQGFDPSMPNLHLGNLVGIQKLRQFQEAGHEVIFLIGDFTGMIGDPTDKSAVRQKLTREQTLANTKNWKNQANKILKFDDPNAAKIKFNSEWLDGVSFKELLEITSNFTAQQMLERDFFQKRLQENKPIYLHEFLYPVAQAIDSVMMDVDLEIGGNDQMFNMMCGRTLMAVLKNKEKFVMTTKLLVDSAGNKIGKTTGNASFLNASANDLFGEIMSFPDEVIALSFELLTTIPIDEIPKSGHPMELKKRLAHQIVTELHSKTAADEAQDNFSKTFQEKKPEEANVETLKATSVDELISYGIVSSKSEWKRLIDQGAIECDGQKVSGDAIKPGIYRIGKKKFIKIVWIFFVSTSGSGKLSSWFLL